MFEIDGVLFAGILSVSYTLDPADSDRQLMKDGMARRSLTASRGRAGVSKHHHLDGASRVLISVSFRRSVLSVFEMSIKTCPSGVCLLPVSSPPTHFIFSYPSHLA